MVPKTNQRIKKSRTDTLQTRSVLILLKKNGEIKGICGIHVDDLLAGGTPEMDAVLDRL